MPQIALLVVHLRQNCLKTPNGGVAAYCNKEKLAHTTLVEAKISTNLAVEDDYHPCDYLLNTSFVC